MYKLTMPRRPAYKPRVYPPRRAYVARPRAAPRARAPYKPRANAAAAAPAPRRNKSSGLFSGLGGLAGTALGGPVGGAIGSGLGSLASTLFGFGDYSVKKNSIVNASSQGVPFMHSTDNTIRIKHKEFITDVTATAAFSNQQFAINPGLASTFPFLSSIAQSFTTYSIEGMVFYYKSTSADALNSTNTALGTMVLASQYDVNEPAYTTKQGMEGSSFGNSAPPSKDQIHPIECDTSQNRASIFYVRSGDVPSTGVASSYDLCNFQIASQGVQATSVVGELWCSYDVIFYKPQVTIPRGLGLPGSLLILSGVTNSTPYGTSMTETWNSFGATINHATGTVLTIPANTMGSYIMTCSWTGDSTASLTVGLNTSNTTPIKVWNGNSQSTFQNTGTALNFIFSAAFQLTDPNSVGTLTLHTATLPANVTAATVHVEQMNGNIPTLV
jgi:hypothetical protein